MKKSKRIDSIGHLIKEARKEAGLSQKEFADLLRVSDKTVSSYEVGRVQPSFSKLKEICKVVHKPLVYFDENYPKDDLDLQIKISIIERELLEIRKMLKKKK